MKPMQASNIMLEFGLPSFVFIVVSRYFWLLFVARIYRFLYSDSALHRSSGASLSQRMQDIIS